MTKEDFATILARLNAVAAAAATPAAAAAPAATVPPLDRPSSRSSVRSSVASERKTRSSAAVSKSKLTPAAASLKNAHVNSDNFDLGDESHNLLAARLHALLGLTRATSSDDHLVSAFVSTAASSDLDGHMVPALCGLLEGLVYLHTNQDELCDILSLSSRAAASYVKHLTAGVTAMRLAMYDLVASTR